MNLTVKGIVISETDFSENDKYITLLTYDHGKISVLCKGVRRKNAPLANKTRLFVFAKFELFLNRDRYILNDVILIERFFEITQDIEHFAICSYFVQLSSKLCEEDFVNIEVTRTLISSLYAISKKNKAQKLVKCALELRLMAYAGFRPIIDRCVVCDKKNHIEQPFFDSLNGGIFCYDCILDKKVQYIVPVTQAVIQAMHHILTCDIEKLYLFKIDEKSFEILCKLCEDYVLMQTDYKFKTLDFYKSMGG